MIKEFEISFEIVKFKLKNVFNVLDKKQMNKLRLNKVIMISKT